MRAAACYWLIRCFYGTVTIKSRQAKQSHLISWDGRVQEHVCATIIFRKKNTTFVLLTYNLNYIFFCFNVIVNNKMILRNKLFFKDHFMPLVLAFVFVFKRLSNGNLLCVLAK